jgi:hypothetical protein
VVNWLSYLLTVPKRAANKTTLTPTLSLAGGEGAIPISACPEGERDRVRGRPRRPAHIPVAARAQCPRQSGMQAVTVISTRRSSEFSAATVTVVLAGLFVGKYFAYSSL